jgi:hypothetical protein
VESAWKSVWVHLMKLLGNMGQVEAHFSPFGDYVNLGARYVHGLHQMYHRLGNEFGHTRWYSYVMWVKCKIISIHLEIVLISMQDRCTVCANVP